jgi:hypothetical protein
VVGYPNVVMAYTRPFQGTPEDLAKLQGRNTGPRVAQSKVDASRKAQSAQLDAIAKQSFTTTPEDEAREKHLNNRYTYGLNSAGVYTYLHDKSKVIREMVLLPAANITFNQTTVQFTGKTGMIRPVSDERGFEVIGHHRYGRGVALRDGSLVLSNENNSQATVGVQLALSGGLYETLQAQTQGLTSVSNYYANPAAIITKLQPEDLQTAAVINPDTKKPEFDSTKTNFVSTAPLNSVERQGAVTPANVEASQLSRALTLVEMAAREEFLKGTTIDPNCECVTGRADLAFINVGYQVQVLNPSVADTDIQSRANAVILKAGDVAENDPLVKLSENPEEALVQAEQREVYKAAADLANTDPDLSQAVLALYNQDGEIRSLSGEFAPTLTTKETFNRVEQYLSTLYRALDEPHQTYEKQLRGELVQVQTRTPSQVRFESDPSETLSPLAPPYSTPNRAAGGDPIALATQAKTALNDAGQAWAKEGGRLKANSERTRLQGEISKDQATVVRLEQEKKELSTLLSSGSVRVGAGDIPSQIAELDKAIAKKSQDISSNQTALGQLNQEFPP